MRMDDLQTDQRQWRAREAALLAVGSMPLADYAAGTLEAFQACPAK